MGDITYFPVIGIVCFRIEALIVASIAYALFAPSSSWASWGRTKSTH
jgi:hypothetical protein